MSYFWIIITPKKQASQFQEDFYNSWGRVFWIGEVWLWMKQNDFKNIPKIYNTFDSYIIFGTQDYLDTCERMTEYRLNQKIKTLQKKWWSTEKIKNFEEEFLRKGQRNPSYQKKLDYLDIIKKLSQKYEIIFWYFWDSREWNGFKNFEIIESQNLKFDEWILYQYKK